jgi:hypothetical protein
VREHLIPKNYEKPKIEIGNYYLEWNNDSYGIYQKEISELKAFLKRVISLVGSNLFVRFVALSTEEIFVIVVVSLTGSLIYPPCLRLYKTNCDI